MAPGNNDTREPNDHERRRSRVFYWWPNPTMEDSTQTGAKMLRTIVIWLVAVIAAVVLIGLLLAL